MRCLYLDFFRGVKINVFRPFFAFRLKMRYPVQKWSRRGNYFGTVDAALVHGYLLFEPGIGMWDEGLPCLSVDCKILVPPILFKFSHSILDWTVLSWNVLEILKNIFRGSLNHIIYWDYMVNRSSFIYCSLASTEIYYGGFLLDQFIPRLHFFNKWRFAHAH